MKFDRILLVVAVLGVVALLVLGFGHRVFGATTPSTTTATYSTESAGTPLLVIGNALTGPNSTGATGYNSKQFQFQGVIAAAATGTTTPCNLQNPFAATSTVSDAYLSVTTGTSSAVQFVFATSSAANATTSVVSTQTLPSGALGTLMIGNTSSSTGIGLVIPANGFVTIGVALGSGSGGLVNVAGSCGAVFQTLP